MNTSPLISLLCQGEAQNEENEEKKKVGGREEDREGGRRRVGSEGRIKKVRWEKRGRKKAQDNCTTEAFDVFRNLFEPVVN